jgi:glycolate oxidase FAD binding subunit
MGATLRPINLDALTALVGTAQVQTDFDAIWSARLEQALQPGCRVGAIVYPETVTQLAAVVALAAQQRWTLVPCGAGSKLDWGGLVGASELLLLSTARLNRLIDHAVGDLTVTVEAGMRFADLQATLAQAGQFLAIDPTYPEQATIGGIVATADTNSGRQRYNSVRDMLLGIQFVRSDGQVAKAGGRVVKNVAGYDLMKLLTGSYGTLGVITELTFRLYPLPAASQTIVLAGEATAIAQAAQTILSSALTPVGFDLVSTAVLPEFGLHQELGLLVRFQSILASVEQQMLQVKTLGKSLQLQVEPLNAEADQWQQLAERMTIAPPSCPIACKIGVRPTAAVTLLQEIARLVPTVRAQIHLSSGLGRLILPEVPAALLLHLRSRCEADGGFLSVLQAPVAVKQAIEVWGTVGTALPLMRQLKYQFDPEARLSPRRFVGGI